MRFRVMTYALFLFVMAIYSSAATPSSFLGQWKTNWQRVDYAGVKDASGKLIDGAIADLTVFEDTPNTNILDGEWTTTDPKTRIAASGSMHGTLTPDGQQWKGVWWGRGMGEHGSFTFTRTGPASFTGKFTAAKHGATEFYWNSVSKKLVK
jgi:hypothetical protein